MHAVLCLLVVVHCVCAKTKENEIERDNLLYTSKDEEIFSGATAVSLTSSPTEDGRTTEEAETTKYVMFSLTPPIQETRSTEVDQSESVTSNEYFSGTTDVPSNFFISSYTSTTTKASCDESPEIYNLTIIEINSFNVTLTWNPSKSQCVKEYVVDWNNKHRSVTDTELLLTDLNACEVHTVGVAGFDGINVGERKTVSFTTAAPNLFSYSIESLKVKEFYKNINVKWQPPTNVSRCITGYYIEWKYSGATKNTTKTVDKFINIPNLPCTQYAITVSPQINKLKGLPRSINYTTKSLLPKIDNFTIAQVGSFDVSLQWEPPKHTNCFDTYAVFLERQVHNTTKDSELLIAPLNACKEYEIGVAVFNGTHYGGRDYKKITTKAPNPFSYRVTELKSEEFNGSLHLTWKPPPDNVSQCVTYYTVLVQWEEDEDTRNETIVTSKNEAQVEVISCMQYEILVYPQSYDVEGLPQNLTYTAKKNPTNPPKIVQNRTDKTEAVITWEIDDTTNKCALLKLMVTCNATDELNNHFPWIITNKTAIMDINSTYGTMTIDGLSPFTNYTCLAVVINTAGNSSSTEFEFSTEEDVPSKPEIEAVDIDAHGFEIRWLEPEKNPGILTGYHVLIYKMWPAYTPWNCGLEPSKEVDKTVNAFQNSYNFSKALPYYQYEISVYGINGAGNGNVATIYHKSKTFYPDPVTNLKLGEDFLHPGKTLITFSSPCYLNGPFKHYEICIHGRRDQYNTSNCDTISETFKRIDLKPEHHYIIAVRVCNTDLCSISTTIETQTDPGVPILGVTLQPPTSNETTKSYFRFSKDAFSDSNGRVLYYALILSKASTSERSKNSQGLWDQTWPPNSITPVAWNPFKNGTSEIVFIIGENETCTEPYCNKRLDEDTEYTLIVRGYTTKTFRDAAPLHFRTLKSSKTGLILGLVFGFLILLIVPVALFLWKRANTLVGTNGGKLLPTSPASISCAKFSSFYETVTENPNILKSQFAALGSQSKEVAGATSYGVLPENKRKNRYTNILPYDHTRVKLQIDEDDEIGSDYINASYIKGYSGRVEYIATQGPLESTSKDFWKMIVQENVTMIVMVSQFIEQSKEKCFQYFPNNHEKVSFGEALDVRCSTELHFGTYCIRTLQVRKDTEQRNVIHLQYLEWPDFGVPQNTDNVLQLCHQMREKASTEGGLIVVHCSAGVGRTGTLIALDILLQTIERQKNLNIYNTVFQLRKQRTNMVQTEKQYVFLHTCIRDYLQLPRISQSNDQLLDHTYENMDILRSSLTKNLLEMESESIL